jgi:hypothetical protein
MATDFSKVDAAEADFDAKMTIYKEKDAALVQAVAARDAAATDLATKEAAVAAAEAVKNQADQDAEAALNIYLVELGNVGITEGGAPPPTPPQVKAKRKYTRQKD